MSGVCIHYGVLCEGGQDHGPRDSGAQVLGLMKGTKMPCPSPSCLSLSNRKSEVEGGARVRVCAGLALGELRDSICWVLGQNSQVQDKY